MPSQKTLPLFALSAAALVSSAIAGPPATPEPAAKEESIYDKIWGIPVIYANKDNAFLQEFRFTGLSNFSFFEMDFANRAPTEEASAHEEAGHLR